MQNNIPELAKLIRYWSLVSTTKAGSGHPTSSLSAADIMAVLMFGGHFRFDLEHPEYFNNDRLIFSKGHASPLFYSAWAVAGQSAPSPSPSPEEGKELLHRAFDPEELMQLRKFGSRFEGHPTPAFPYTEVPTGSLGQGLSVGVGEALSARLDKLHYRTWVLLGDSEMAEGSVWEAMEIGAHYQLSNLVAILDCNRLGQRGETMLGHNVDAFAERAQAFGWEPVIVDGHDLEALDKAFVKATAPGPHEHGRPVMVIAKTVKGKGVSFLEDKDGWHGKALSAEELKKALEELGSIDKSMVGEIALPESVDSTQNTENSNKEIKFTEYDPLKPVATRKAYGNILPKILDMHKNAAVLDAEVSNSTYAETVKKTHPDRFFEMYIAEQNMAGAALGFSRRGKIPFVSTFAAFLSRAFDQIRMSQYAGGNIKFVGSHVGVSIGEDGSSQMGLEEIAMFRTLRDSVVLYPSDAISTEKLAAEAAAHQGNVYIQTTRKETPIIYSPDDEFKIGGSKTVTSSEKDVVTVIGAGITLHEALAAYEQLHAEGIHIRVIDLYSIKPVDIDAVKKAAQETKAIITVEDNYPEGGIGEAVASVLAEHGTQNIVHSLAVRKIPKSGKPDELLAYEEINKDAIVKLVKELVSK